MRRSDDARKDLPRVDRRLTVLVRHADKEQVCILENASRSGAGLRVNPDLPLPRRFDLVLEDLTLPVLLKWRRSESAGVRFDFEGAEPSRLKVLLGIR